MSSRKSLILEGAQVFPTPSFEIYLLLYLAVNRRDHVAFGLG